MIKPRITPVVGGFMGAPAWRCTTRGSRTSHLAGTPLRAYQQWLIKYRPYLSTTHGEKLAMMRRVGLL